jgi:hypothetical protein
MDYFPAVMPGLVPGISMEWHNACLSEMAGTSPAMTNQRSG